jgi:WD40 repeat protein
MPETQAQGNDRTIRIWNNRNHTEVARLAHNSSILAVAWMQGDAGIVSLADDGVISKWTRTVSSGPSMIIINIYLYRRCRGKIIGSGRRF